MKTKTKLAPMTIKVENNKVLCNKNGNKFIDLLGDLGWDYQRMTSSGRETYDEIMQKANSTNNQEERYKLLNQAEKILIELIDFLIIKNLFRW